MESLGLHPSEIMDVMEDREERQLNLKLLFPQPSRKAGNEERRRCLVGAQLDFGL